MTVYLPDVNVLIALLDRGHVHHGLAHGWFARQGSNAWTLLRVVGHARYPNCPGNSAAALPVLIGLRQLPGHAFWSDDISLAGSDLIDGSRLVNSGQVTDSYLLALAAAHGGQLASFDRRLITDAVRGGPKHLHLIC